MPVRMFKGRINMLPGSRVVYKDHQANGGPPKYVKGIRSLRQAFHSYKYRNVIDYRAS